MSTAFIIMCVCFGIAFLLMKDMSKTQQKEKLNGIVMSDHYARYIGGLPDLAGGKDATLYIKENEITLETFGVNPITKIINMKDITKAEIQSETQINQSVGLGKLIMFGVLAFGMKKKSEVKSYLLLGYKDNNEERNIILESTILEQITQTIRKYAFN
ncbi:putative MurF [Clostridium botulinum C str. Eklund]|nr:putative MurF [Clostridium botulinum C str. Eklund]